MLSNSRPRILGRPETVGTYGPKVVEFLEQCGLSYFDWQKAVLYELFAVDAAGNWSGKEWGVLVARQNGKGEILVGYALAHLFLFPRADGRRKTILYTAHEMKTSTDGMERIKAIIESNPFLMARVKRIYAVNGRESIQLKPRKGQKLGDRIKFVARSKNSGRGFSADVIVHDEAQEESRRAYSALSYTKTTVRNKQELFTGTVPEEGVNDSEVFEGVRDRGRSGSPRTGWMEWSPEGADDPELAVKIDVTDETAWLAANPSCPELFGLDTIEDDLRADVSPNFEDFRRERLSIWPNRRADEVKKRNNEVDMAAWAEGNVSMRLGAGGVLAVSLGRGGGYSSIAGGQELADGRIFLEHLDTRRQTRWVVDELVKLRTEHKTVLVVLDEKNAAPIVPDLKKAGVPFMAMNMSEVASAFDLFVEHVNAGVVDHPDQSEVVTALEHAVPRFMNKPQNLQTWDQGDPSEPVTQVQAMTLALWAVKKWAARPASVPAPPPAAVEETSFMPSYTGGFDLNSVHF